VCRTERKSALLRPIVEGGKICSGIEEREISRKARGWAKRNRDRRREEERREEI